MAALSFNCMVSASAEGRLHATRAESKRHNLNITRHYSRGVALTSEQPAGRAKKPEPAGARAQRPLGVSCWHHRRRIAPDRSADFSRLKMLVAAGGPPGSLVSQSQMGRASWRETLEASV